MGSYLLNSRLQSRVLPGSRHARPHRRDPSFALRRRHPYDVVWSRGEARAIARDMIVNSAARHSGGTPAVPASAKSDDLEAVGQLDIGEALGSEPISNSSSMRHPPAGASLAPTSATRIPAPRTRGNTQRAAPQPGYGTLPSRLSPPPTSVATGPSAASAGPIVRLSKLRPRMRQQRVKLSGLDHPHRWALSDDQVRQAANERAFANGLAAPATRVRMRLGQRTAPPPSFHLAAECGHRPGQPDVDDGQRDSTAS